MSPKRIITRLGRWLGYKRRINDLDEELQFHLEKEVEQNLAAGMLPDEARRRALIALGGVQQARESVRRVYWIYLWEMLLQDLRYALRMLRKSPAFTLVSILILALGIGMNSAIFSLIDAVLFRALPIQDPQSLVLLRWHAHAPGKSLSVWGSGDCANVDQKVNPSGCLFSLPFFRAAQSQTDVFSNLTAFAGASQIALSGNGPATILNSAELVSGNYFQALGVGAALGRALVPDDDMPSAPPVMMLGYAYWQSAFGGDPGVIGKMVRLNGAPFTIIGVTERGFDALTPARRYDVWLPLSVRSQLVPNSQSPREDQQHFWWLVIVGRIKPGIPRAQAQAAISLLYHNQALHEGKPLFEAAADPGIAIVTAQQGLEGSRGQILQPLYVLLLAVGLVLLIACANVAGLLLARGMARRKEIAVRLTLGARRSRLLFQLLIESLMLSLLGGAAGLFLALWGARALVAAMNYGASGPKLTPHLDAHVLLFTAAAAVLTGIIFGLLPAFRSLRLDLTPALKSGSGGAAARESRNRWYSLGNSLVVAQVALAMVALVAAGLLVHTLKSLRGVELGFEPQNLLLFGIDPTLAGYKDNQADALYGELQQQFASLPGVSSVSYSWCPMLEGCLWTTDFHRHGTPERETADTDYFPVGPGFFKTMGIPMKAGRDFSSADFAIAAAEAAAEKAHKTVPDAPPLPVIVNETFVRRFLSGSDPLGQYIEPSVSDDPSEPRGPGWRVVGVARDAKYNEVRREINPTVYAPSSGVAVFFEVRTAVAPKLLVPTIRDLVNRTDSKLALFRISTQMEQVDVVLKTERMLASLSTLFGVLALTLACVGLYGLLSYEVAQRTREIGIRMAVGARRLNVIQMVIKQALLLALAGAVVGIAASFVASRLLSSVLYGVRAGDPITLASVAALLLLVTLASCYLPARRATRIDPLIALRYE